MYHRLLSDCFPYEDLPVLFECINQHCFYHETLLKWSEVVVKEEWNGETLEPVPKCPSCNTTMARYEDPDGKTTTFL